jgi:hypothetical protein
MQAKNKHSILMVLFSLALTGSLLAAKKIDFTEAKVRYTGLTLFQTNEGSGFGGYLEYSLKNADRLVAQLNFVSVSGDDYPLYYYDYYTGQTYYYENADKRRLMFLPLYIGYKKVLFADQIANNFRPYLEVLGGAVMALDPPNISDFSERIKKMTTAWAPGYQLGGGIDFLYGPGVIVSLFAGYDYVKFGHKIDIPETYYYDDGTEVYNNYSGQKDFSGLVLKLSFGKKF